MAMLKLCRCGKCIPIGDSSCSECSNQGDRHKIYDKHQRDKKSAKFYSSGQWQRVREQVMIRDKGLCVHCLADKSINKADVVDHIVPIKQQWSLRLSMSNCQALCNHHHAIKTNQDKIKYGK